MIGICIPKRERQTTHGQKMTKGKYSNKKKTDSSTSKKKKKKNTKNSASSSSSSSDPASMVIQPLCSHFRSLIFGKVKQHVEKLSSRESWTCSKNKNNAVADEEHTYHDKGTIYLDIVNGDLLCYDHLESQWDPMNKKKPQARNKNKKKKKKQQQQQQHCAPFGIYISLKTLECYCRDCESLIGYREEQEAHEQQSQQQQQQQALNPMTNDLDAIKMYRWIMLTLWKILKGKSMDSTPKVIQHLVKKKKKKNNDDDDDVVVVVDVDVDDKSLLRRNQNDATTVIHSTMNERTIAQLGNNALIENKKVNWCMNANNELSSVRGLTNLGNTCFFNSVMQCWAQSWPLVTHFLNWNTIFPPDDDKHHHHHLSDTCDLKKLSLPIQDSPVWAGPLSLSLKWFYEDYYSTQNRETTMNSVVNPSRLFKQIIKIVPSFRGFGQQDSQEFLRFLSSFVSDEYLSNRRENSKESVAPVPVPVPVGHGDSKHATMLILERFKPSNIIHYLFQIIQCSTIICTHCSNISKTYEPVFDLSLPIPHYSQQEQQLEQEYCIERELSSQLSSDNLFVSVSSNRKNNNNNNNGRRITVEDCLWEYVKSEMLKDENAYLCEKCSSEMVLNEEGRDNIAAEDSHACNRSHIADVDNENTANDTHTVDQLDTRMNNMSITESKTESKHHQLRKAIKQLTLMTLPYILTVHFKRFIQSDRSATSSKRRYDYRGSLFNGGYVKDDTYIELSQELDLEPYMNPSAPVQNSTKYRLYGIVEHSGDLNFGHYVAFVRPMRLSADGNVSREDTWTYISDTHVRQGLGWDRVKMSGAYIAFYERIQ
jgi:ubiquitin C-terminal hydrolase